MLTETSCHFGHLLQVSKHLLVVWFYTICSMILYMYIAPGQGLTTPWGLNFDVNRNVLSLRSFVASFKNISLKSAFIHFFHDFIHEYSPRAGADSPPGDKILISIEMSSHFIHLLKFSKQVFDVWFYIYFFHDLIHVYSTDTGADSLQRTQFWCHQKGLITFPICCKFQRNLFEVWFYTIVFMI